MNLKNILSILTILLVVFAANGQKKYAIAIHGGAGVMSKDKINEEKRLAYKSKLNEALDLGDKMLNNGATATEVVVEVIKILEDSPLFNAGKGAVFNHDGINELDASIMEGKALNAGAIAGVRDIKNPICAALEVMNNSKHVFLSGEGASAFAKKQGLEIVPNKYFFTESRYQSLQRLLQKERERSSKDNMGTVGCAVLDLHGNLCAGTSTGGMTNKKFGRIGDAPIIGAGTYANNKTCAVSCTGHGEYYIRLCFARDISAMMEYQNLSISEAFKEEINKLSELKGTGGVIGVDASGNIAMEFNTSGMFRGYLKSSGEREVAIFKNE